MFLLHRSKVSLYDRRTGRFSAQALAFGQEIETRLLPCFRVLRQKGFNGRELIGESLIRIGLAQADCAGRLRDYDPSMAPDEKGLAFVHDACPVLKDLVVEAATAGWKEEEVTHLFAAFLALPAGRSMELG
jgi:hypothetical protein